MRWVRASVAGLVFGLVGLVLALIVGSELGLDRWRLAGVALVAVVAVGGGVMMALRVLRAHRTAEASGVARVGFWARAVARLVDEAVVVAGVVFLAMPVLGGVEEYLTAVPEPVQAGHASISLIYWTMLHARARQTVGKLLVGAAVVDASTLTPIGYPRAAVRLVATVVSLLPFGLGFLWAAWDPDRQTFHDKIARTVVLKKADLAPRAGESRRRRSGLLLVGGGALAVAAVLWASAETELPTLELADSEGKPGTTIEVQGSRFATGEATGPVTIRWDDTDGKVLATVEPDDSGGIEAAVTIPDSAEPGFHVVVATQAVAGRDEPSSVVGTPARASIHVMGEPPPGHTVEPPSS